MAAEVRSWWAWLEAAARFRGGARERCGWLVLREGCGGVAARDAT